METNQLIETARKAVGNGDVGLALSSYKRVIGLTYEKDLDLLLEVALYTRQIGLNQQSVECYKRSIELCVDEERRENICHALVELYFVLNEFVEIVKILELYKNQITVSCRWKMVEFKLNYFRDTCLSEFVSEDECYLSYMHALLELKKYNLIIEKEQELLVIGSRDYLAIKILVAAYFEVEDYQSAMVLLNGLSSYEFKDFEVAKYLVATTIAQGNYKAARQLVDKYESIFPGDGAKLKLLYTLIEKKEFSGST